jgi:hypothetical protein
MIEVALTSYTSRAPNTTQRSSDHGGGYSNKAFLSYAPAECYGNKRNSTAVQHRLLFPLCQNAHNVEAQSPTTPPHHDLPTTPPPFTYTHLLPTHCLKTHTTYLKVDGHSTDLFGIRLEAVAEVASVGQVQAHDAVVGVQQTSEHLRARAGYVAYDEGVVKYGIQVGPSQSL